MREEEAGDLGEGEAQKKRRKERNRLPCGGAPLRLPSAHRAANCIVPGEGGRGEAQLFSH